MEGDDREPAAGREQSLGGVEAALQLAELVVHGDAERLKCSGCRIDAAGLRRHHLAHDRRELTGAPDRRRFPGGEDGAGDAPREALLAVKKDNVGERRLGQRIDEIRRRRPLPLHPHVERPVGTEGQAASGIVELRRGRAEVEGDAGDIGNPECGQQLFHVAVAAFDQRQPAGSLRRQGRAAGDRIRVAIDGVDAAAHGLEQGARIAAAAERTVDVNPVVTRGERVNRLGEKNRDVGRVVHRAAPGAGASARLPGKVVPCRLARSRNAP